MRWTLAELESWRGREALDGDAEPAGEIVATFVDEHSGAPRWLAVRTGAHGDDVLWVNRHPRRTFHAHGLRNSRGV